MQGHLVTSGGLPAWDNTGKLGWGTSQNLDLSGQSEIWFFGVVDVEEDVQNRRIIELGDFALVNSITVATQGDVTGISVYQRVATGFCQHIYTGFTNGRYLLSVRFRANQTVANAIEIYLNGVLKTGNSATNLEDSATLPNGEVSILRLGVIYIWV